MLWNIIKKNLSKGGGRCIVIDSEKSVYLVKKIDTKSEDSEKEKTEEANRNVDQWKAEEQDKETVDIENETEIKVEDLPI